MVGAEGERYTKKSEASAQVPRYVEYTTRNSNRGLWIVVQTFLVREKAEQKIRHILFRREKLRKVLSLVTTIDGQLNPSIRPFSII